MPKPKILVVDDSEIMRAHVVDLLEKVIPECEFVTASSPADGLKTLLAGASGFCFVLTDHVMGADTGLQFLMTLGLLEMPEIKRLGRAIMTDQGRLANDEVAAAEKHKIRILAKPTVSTEKQFIDAVRSLVTPCLNG